MAFVFPFNFKPVNVVAKAGIGTSYTCPAGKYALITFTISASSRGSGETANAANASANAVCGQIWINAGETVTSAIIATNGVQMTHEATVFTKVTAQSDGTTYDTDCNYLVQEFNLD